MSEMVERVARAIHDAADKEAGEGEYISYAMAEAAARAAIEAMREPTGRMWNSGAAKWDDDWCTETNALNMWQAMIDEALKG